MRYLIGALLLLSTIASAEDVSLPLAFCRERNAMTVSITVNGKPRRFLIDSGAEMTVVSPEVVGRNMVDLKGSTFSQGGPGMAGDAILFHVNLAFGSRSWQERPVAVMDLQKVHAIYGSDIDGLLGLDLLREFSSVKVDFRNRQLVLSK